MRVVRVLELFRKGLDLVRGTGTGTGRVIVRAGVGVRDGVRGGVRDGAGVGGRAGESGVGVRERLDLGTVLQ